MQIVINIDDENYDDITLTGENTINLGVLLDLREAVRKGTPLPKGHGKLIDADKLKQRIEMADDDIIEEDWYKLYDNVISDIDNAPTIIEADREKL